MNYFSAFITLCDASDHCIMCFQLQISQSCFFSPFFTRYCCSCCLDITNGNNQCFKLSGPPEFREFGHDPGVIKKFVEVALKGLQGGAGPGNLDGKTKQDEGIKYFSNA